MHGQGIELRHWDLVCWKKNQGQLIPLSLLRYLPCYFHWTLVLSFFFFFYCGNGGSKRLSSLVVGLHRLPGRRIKTATDPLGCHTDSH